MMESGALPNLAGFDNDEKEFIQSLNLLSTKPMLLIANLSDDQSKNKLEDLQNYAEANSVSIIPAVVKIEHELANLEAEEQREYLELLGMDEPVLNKIILAGYKLLNLETYFTSGPEESRAWTIPKGAKAPQAAGVIHTDFEKGFIKAEVVSFSDLDSAGSMAQAKSLGKARIEGKDYTMQDGDVVEFRFNV